jgi:hypothetical protein
VAEVKKKNIKNQTTPGVMLRSEFNSRSLSNAPEIERFENPLKPRYDGPPVRLARADGAPDPIWLCVICHSKDLAEERHRFWLWNRSRFVCNECGATLQQVGDKYMLSRVPSRDHHIWQKYAGKMLYSREWANIANGGLSDEEIIVSWSPYARPAND